MFLRSYGDGPLVRPEPRGEPGRVAVPSCRRIRDEKQRGTMYVVVSLPLQCLTYQRLVVLTGISHEKVKIPRGASLILFLPSNSSTLAQYHAPRYFACAFN